MAIDTLYGDDVLLLGDPVIWGTCMLGDDLGSVVSCRLKRTANLQDISDQHGELLAMLMLQARFELELETVFDAGVAVPGLFDTIEFPYLKISGRITEADIAWERGTERALSIRASQWDSLINASLNGSGLGSIELRGDPGGFSLLLNTGAEFLLNSNTPLKLAHVPT
jgi:hypothetical protein